MLPSVTIITPTTYGRALYNINCGLIASSQGYKGKIEHLWDYDSGTVGEKRNRLVERAKGDIILHFDSDDYYAPDWVSKSVEALTSSNAAVVGLEEGYFYDGNRLFKYIYKPGQRYLLGATLCYYKTTWERSKFPDISKGEEGQFYANAGLMLPHDYLNGFAASIHPGNTCPRHTFMREVFEPVDISLKKLLPLP